MLQGAGERVVGCAWGEVEDAEGLRGCYWLVYELGLGCHFVVGRSLFFFGSWFSDWLVCSLVQLPLVWLFLGGLFAVSAVSSIHEYFAVKEATREIMQYMNMRYFLLGIPLPNFACMRRPKRLKVVQRQGSSL